jgi:prepilin-type N-terminal cleavage/methylation domain-containing protein
VRAKRQIGTSCTALGLLIEGAVGSRLFLNICRNHIIKPLAGFRPHKSKPSRVMKLAKSSQKGFTLIEIMIVVAIIGLLAAIAIPSFVHARTSSQQNACINNLRQIDGAKQNWALDNKESPTTTPLSSDIQTYLGRGTGSLPWCPSDVNSAFSSSYDINSLQMPPSCQIVPTSHVYD